MRPAAALSRALKAGAKPRSWKLFSANHSLSSERNISESSEARKIPSGGLSYNDDGALTVAVPCEINGTTCLMSLLCRNAHSLDNGEHSREVAVGVAAVPAGTCVLDLGWYKNGALVVLLENEDGAQLALVPSEVLNLQVMESSNVLDSGEESLAQILGGGGGGGIFSSGCDVLDFGEFRRRELPYKNIQLPLAVSATRGIGFVLTAQKRAILYDLEEDEEEEGEEDVDE